MPFMAINGLVVPVADCSMDQSQDIRPDKVMQSGRVRRERVAAKRVWSVKTAPIELGDAVTLQNLLLAVGQYWPWNDSDVFSSKGLPSNGAGVTFVSDNASVAPYTADGAVNPLAPHDGNNALVMASAVTNLISSPSYEGESLPPFPTVNGGYALRTNSVSATQPALQGSAALVIGSSASATPAGAEAGSATVSPGLLYTASVYLNSPVGMGTQTITVQLVDDKGGTASATVSVPEATWVRGVVSLTTLASATKATLRVLGPANIAFRVICDCAQIERSVYAGRWTRTSFPSSNVLSYPLAPEDYRDAKAVTISCWARYQPGPTAAAQDVARPLFYLQSSLYGWAIAVVTQPGNPGLLNYVVYRNGTAIQTLPATTNASATSWNHFILQAGQGYDKTPYSNTMAFWHNGVQVRFIPASQTPDIGTLDTLYWGSNPSGAGWQETIDTGVYMPFWAGAQACAMLAQSPSPYYAPPDLRCTGDFCDGQQVLCAGYDAKLSIIQMPQSDGMGRFGVLAFTLVEL